MSIGVKIVLIDFDHLSPGPFDSRSANFRNPSRNLLKRVDVRNLAGEIQQGAPIDPASLAC